MLLTIILVWIAVSLPLGIIAGRIIDAGSRREPGWRPVLPWRRLCQSPYTFGSSDWNGPGSRASDLHPVATWAACHVELGGRR